MTIGDLLKTHSIDAHDAELIIAHVLGRSQTFVIAHPEYTLTPQEAAHMQAAFVQRAEGVPLAYITEHKEFYGRSFAVTRDTLVPRPETEILVEQAVAHIQRTTGRHVIVDIGTGSGIIAVTIATELQKQGLPKDATAIVATDTSTAALAIAQDNAARHGIADAIHFQQANLLDQSLQEMLAQHTDRHITLCANLPYVDTESKEALLAQPLSAGLRYEPAAALWSDDGGLAHYTMLLEQIATLWSHSTAPSLTNFYEIDPAQKEPLVHRITQQFPQATLHFHKDYAQKWRICEWSVKTYN